MNLPYFYEQSFFQLLSDAIHFLKLAKTTSGVYQSQRFARASIINSTLTIESAANCCLSKVKGTKSFIADIDRLTPFSKFDLFSKLHESDYIDRGSHITQKVIELKKIRDLAVHPKKLKIPIEVSLDNDKYESLIEMGVNFDASPLPATKIDKSSMFWFAKDAETALSTIFDFYDYYFMDLLKLKHNEVLGMLGSGIIYGKGKFILFHQQELQSDLSYADSIGIKQRFINLNSLSQLNSSVM